VAQFKSLKALEFYIKSKIQYALQSGQFLDEIKQTMESNILREVYLAYTPKKYKRRGSSGGLLDDENITHDLVGTNMVEVYNIAKRNTAYANTTYTNPYLAPLIELGHKQAVDEGYQGYNYPYKYLAYYKPRPFIRETRQELRRTKRHVRAFKEALKSFGISSE
jgi:hypothetical protein